MYRSIIKYQIACLTLLCSATQAVTSSRAPSLPYITGDGFRAHADFVFDETNRSINPKQIRTNSIIFVATHFIDQFFTTIHPHISSRYILITHNSDASAPGAWAHILDDPHIIAWFGQNIEGYIHPKLHSIPIGLTNQYHPYGDVATFHRVRSQLTKIQKKHLLHMNFSLTTFPNERQHVYHLFKSKPFCFMAPRTGLEGYLRDIAASYFVLSPRGNGIDCCRTWESLLMGSYPIVKSSYLDPLFIDLPVIIIKDWHKVTEQFLQEKYREFQAKSFDMRKAYLQYWLDLIDSYKIEHRR